MRGGGDIPHLLNFYHRRPHHPTPTCVDPRYDLTPQESGGHGGGLDSDWASGLDDLEVEGDLDEYKGRLQLVYYHPTAPAHRGLDDVELGADDGRYTAYLRAMAKVTLRSRGRRGDESFVCVQLSRPRRRCRRRSSQLPLSFSSLLSPTAHHTTTSPPTSAGQRRSIPALDGALPHQ